MEFARLAIGQVLCIWLLKKRRMASMRRLSRFKCNYHTRSISNTSLNNCTENTFFRYSIWKRRTTYNQIPIALEDRPNTAIITPFGLFEFLVMSFGLCNAAQTFQRFMDQIFHDFNFVIVYIDDILIFSENIHEHRIHVRMVFERLREHG